MNTPLVEQLEDYPWSSYPAFIGKAKAVNWLTREYTYQLLGYPHRYKHYRNFVMLEMIQRLKNFMAKIIGRQCFNRHF
jgi:putative transposase